MESLHFLQFPKDIMMNEYESIYTLQLLPSYFRLPPARQILQPLTSR